MGPYAIRRLLLLAPVLFGVSLAIFALRWLIPGDPVDAMFAGQTPDRDTIARVRHDLGYDRSLPEQYLSFATGALRGDLGKSVRSGRPVLQEIQDRYPATLQLAVAGMVLAVVLGTVLGALAAMRRNTIWDSAVMGLSTLGQSVPAFWLGLVLILTFAVQLRWLPVLANGGIEDIVLPSVTIGLIAAALIARMTRSSLLDVLSQDYIRTARAKGLGDLLIVGRHALPNAALPVVTVLGLQFGHLLAGAFIVEVVFGWHGLGELVVNAIEQRDFPVVQGGLLVVSSTYVLANTVVDLLYGVLDPRVSYN
jgi:ABC-type dipeptide/oligopeptide/nickel transport system permease component